MMKTNSESIRLQQIRTESKLTQMQLAQYLGIDQTTVTKLEKGTRKLNVSMIEKICNLFGCSESFLLGEDDDFIPLNFSFRSNNIQTEDLESIAAVNKIVMNIRFMNKIMGE